jgi:hypothetical protein
LPGQLLLEDGVDMYRRGRGWRHEVIQLFFSTLVGFSVLTVVEVGLCPRRCSFRTVALLGTGREEGKA